MNYPHDKRLDILKVGQYRLWHDAHNILVPVGQSTTKPLTKELIQCNVRVYGEIHNGFFRKPLVDFTNTHVHVERFDKYYLQLWRDFNQLPYYDDRLDYHHDLGLNEIHARYSISFSCAEFMGYDGGELTFKFLSGNTWATEHLHFSNYDLQSLNGRYYFVCNPTVSQQLEGLVLNTGLFLQEVNLPIFCIVLDANIKNGNSELDLQLRNDEYIPLYIYNVAGEIVGGE